MPPAQFDILRKNFSTVTPENCMKPKSVQATEGKFDFSKADAIVAMAHSNGMTVNGHTLVWHNHCPEWFFEDGGKPASGELVLKRMKAHIAAVAGHFAGKVASWDVVNEALADKGDYLRDSKWLQAIGPNFIAEAFKAAHLADPKAELYYNDYRIEIKSKRERAIRLIKELKAQQIPIDGIGIQGHWQLDKIPFKEIEEAIVAFHELGLKVSITELDINVYSRGNGGDSAIKLQPAEDLYANGLPPEMLKRQAEQYGQLYALFLKHSDKIERVTTWGFYDGYSWLNIMPFKCTNYPLFWDRNLQPKPALAAVLKAPSLVPKP